jgi:hypothetical protein
VAMLGAMCSTPQGFANAWHIRPMLYDGLRAMANEKELRAVAIAECVEEIPGIEKTRAIKVHVEHSAPTRLNSSCRSRRLLTAVRVR